MENSNQNQYNWSSANMFLYIYSKRKPLLIVTVAAIIISAIVSFLIPPKFKSVTTIFPAAPVSVSQNLLGEYSTKRILNFGEEEEVDQMMQVLNSGEIRGRLNSKYKLMDHYEIKKEAKYPNTEFYKKFTENVIFKRTEYMSIDIIVYDRDPEVSANMANDIADLVDTVMNHIQKDKAIKAFRIVEKEYLAYEKEMKAVEDSLTKIKKLGINNYNSMSEVVYEAYAKAIARGQTSGLKKLEDKMELLSKYGSSYNYLSDKVLSMMTKYVIMKSKYIEAKVDVEQDLSYRFVVDRAYPPEKKATPIRWIIVVASTIAAFTLALVLFMILDNFKKPE